MTPAARVQAAIEILDHIGTGVAGEQALTGWARKSRFAGSKDRAAVRDHVFDVLRRRRSCAACGGGTTGRALLTGLLVQRGDDPRNFFTGEGHAPAPLSELEIRHIAAPHSDAERLDLPDWLWAAFRASLGERAEACAGALRNRAPVFLRVNRRRADLDSAREALARDGIQCHPHAAAETALEVTQGARRVRQSSAFREGTVELQDAASQAVVETLGLRDGMRVLDFCAGGGGKTLAMAAQAEIEICAYDSAAQRMRDLPARAGRAGVQVRCLDRAGLEDAGTFDLVLCDAPCSGSGAWRRAPEAKWSLTPQKLSDLANTQLRILEDAERFLAGGGTLAYATCSLLKEENEDVITTIIQRNTSRSCTGMQRWYPDDGIDGFFCAQLTAR